ncbi:MAG: M48 family metalloprotease [Thainema sp.]
MPSPSRPESSNQPPSSAAVLKQGLSALKQKQYDQAIQSFHQVVQLSTDAAEYAQAQMGLVKAYGYRGQTEAAIATCTQLTRNSSPKVQAWAARTLEKLQQQNVAHPDQSHSNIASSPTPSSSTRAEHPPERLSRQELQTAETNSSEPQGTPLSSTGFVPLDASLDDARKPGHETGFVALDDVDDDVQPSRPPLATPRMAPPPSSPTPADVATASPATQPSANQELEQPTSPLSDLVNRFVDQSLNPDQPDPNTAVTANPPADTPTAAQTAADPAVALAQSAPPISYQPTWQQAERAERWSSLPPVNQTRFWIIQAVTVVGSIWLIRSGTWFLLRQVNKFLAWLDWPIHVQPIQAFYRDPFWMIALFLAVLFAASPWLWDFLLSWFYGQKPFSLQILESHSPESVRFLKRFFRQSGRTMPELRVLPSQAPLILTYGNLPRFARISVSQGLLNQLADDEIATLYAREASQIQRWDFVTLSWIALIMQLPYLLYDEAAKFGNRLSQPILRGCFAFVASAGYGLYWLLRWLGLWANRNRTYHSDRTSVSLTGNPNGLIRALLKVAIGSAEDIQRQGRTSSELESLNLLSPTGYAASLTVGSTYPYTPIEPILQWDYQNPYRHWLATSQAHPALGERLYILTRYAQRWHLTPELDLESPPPRPKAQNIIQQIAYWQPLLFQASPWVGLVCGFAIAWLLKFIGWFSPVVNIYRLQWMWDSQSLLWACILIGFGIGTWLRVNRLFPDFTPGAIRNQPNAHLLLTDPVALPTNTLPVKIQGKLLGRSGLHNWLGQDLLMQSQQGLIKLRYASALGVLGNLFLQSAKIRPEELTGRRIQIVGWFRRSVLSWIDLDHIKNQAGYTIRANSPTSATLLGGICIAWGLFLLVTGR